MAYETFDIDLMEGKERERAFAKVMLGSLVEHKRDHIAVESGNVAIEYEQKMRDGKIVPSGIAITEADWWAVEFRPDCWTIAPTEYVKELARAAIKQGRHKWIGDGPNNHHNALVPFGWFLRGGV